MKEGKPLAEGFLYASDNNDQWFLQEDFKKMIQEL
jgi:hypothetical protein